MSSLLNYQTHDVHALVITKQVCAAFTGAYGMWSTFWSGQ